MARVYGMLGSEKALIGKLRGNDVNVFKTLRDVEKYIKNSDIAIEAKKEEVRKNVKKELEDLELDLESLLKERQTRRSVRAHNLSEELNHLDKELANPIEDTRNPIIWLYRRIKRWRNTSRRDYLANNFIEELDRPLKSIVSKIRKTKSRIEYGKENLDEIIEKRMKPYYEQRKHIDRVLDYLGEWIAGAKGEQKTLEELKNLSNNYCIINDVKIRLKPPIKSEYGGIVSCQIDHVVVGPPGVFNIESKYWSKASADNKDIYSPAKQAIRNGRGLFTALQRKFRGSKSKIGRLFWRGKKIRVRNVVSTVGARLDTNLDYVTILRPENLVNYIQRFKRNLPGNEVSKIAKWLWKKSR